ncbi:hypothetical protein F0562_027619 [Nyssa sinensis]|uniref:Receptor-like serine/threonine-protein kinase n=1 Tax=Nyssa sinensis TaxID=561372 RepID=A0A5J5B9C2_9ASTE|nr:hypothetical protein F0562_027619 [Nyssa sinensis]
MRLLFYGRCQQLSLDVSDSRIQHFSWPSQLSSWSCCLMNMSSFLLHVVSTLRRGSSLSVEIANDVLISPNGVFLAGYHRVGDNAFCFAIWFKKSSGPTLVWMANRDNPVNGKGSKLTLLKDGNLILTDAGRNTLWTTGTNSSAASVQLHLHDTGNLVLSTSEDDHTLWQSFDSPTNTLLPQQPLTRYKTLVSSRSQTNYSSGFYKLSFDNDNVLILLYDGPEVSSIYWPDPWLLSWDTDRTTFNNSKIAVFDTSGYFSSSDHLQFSSADYGWGPQRRLTLDFDGNLRLYSLDEMTGNWTVTWQAMADPCKVHGLCGPNSICGYGSGAGRGCSCLPGYKVKNPKDWSNGCELEFNTSSNDHKAIFLSVRNIELYGYEYDFFKNNTLESCKMKCSQSSICKGFLFKFEEGIYNCYPKSLLLNGKSYPYLLGTLYVKLNVSTKGLISSNEPGQEIKLNCSGEDSEKLDREYRKKGEGRFLKFFVFFTYGIGSFELLLVFVVCWVMFSGRKDSSAGMQGYLLAATGFRKFTYGELRKATRGFRDEIGRGGGGVVHKGVLSDGRVAAIKRLNEANQGEQEFLAEVSTIGRINHMNLIEMWGYCAEGRRRLLVYELMERGSLAQNLHSHTLDWKKRFEIAVGTAKGLAYLHEECLEWILHCDIKPENILLDFNYQPKVSDFGLAKLLNRGGDCNLVISRMRGTRGYMAPEWVFNRPITSKVDVYSYGIVVLEMVTGRSPINVQDAVGEEGETEDTRLVAWVREKMHGTAENASWIEEIIDPAMESGYDMGRMEILVRVALQCAEEDEDARPTMSQVLEMLLRHEE